MNWQTRLPKLENHFHSLMYPLPSPLAPVIAKVHPLIHCRQYLSHNSLYCLISSVSSIAQPTVYSPNFAAAVTTCFILLSKQDKMGEFFLQRLRSSTAGSNSPYSRLSYIRSFRRAIFDVWSKPWGVADYWVSRAPIPREVSGSTTNTRCKCISEGV